MARTRELKAQFFTDGKVRRLPVAARYLFAALWCLADREGRLPDDPDDIEVYVGDIGMSVCDALDALNPQFITRYEADGARYIQVNNFSKHQHVHPREMASQIPAPRMPGREKARQGLPNADQGEPRFEIMPIPSGPSGPSGPSEGVTGGGGNSARAEDINPFGEPTAPPVETIEGYLTNIIGTLGGGCTDEFRGYQEVIDDDAIRLAVDEADANKARTWGYIRTILRRWVSSGIKTAADARDDLAKFRATKDAKARAAPITYDPSKILNTPDRYAKRPDDFGDEFMRRLEEKERAKARPGQDDAGDHRD